MVGNIGPLEIAIVVIVALLVFGPKRLPELGKSVGSSIREFKGSVSEMKLHSPDEKNQIAAASQPATPAVAAATDDQLRATTSQD